MLTIYGNYRSRAARPIWMCHELGVPFTHRPVIQAYRLADPQAPDAPFNTASPEFRALNPQGQIPCVEQDGMVLTESLAITLWLARRHGGDLAPADLDEEAQVTMWTLFAATAVEDPALDILRVRAAGAQDSPEGAARIAAAVAALQLPLARVEAQLAGHDWLVGGRFTVADLNLAECLRYAQTHAAAFEGFPRVADWLARAQARPAFRRMMQEREAEPA